jgi:hypothetical protein
MPFGINLLQPTLFLFFLVLSFLSVRAQVRLEGIVADKKTGEPIPFVHLVVKNKLTGTASNADGIFRIDISGLTDKDSLKITHLNYSPVTVAVRDMEKDARVFLTEQVTVLSEITVKATDDYAVMEEMIQRTKESTGIPFTASYYYRELVREDSSYNKFADGILTVTYEPENELTVRVDQCRVYALQKDEDVEIDQVSPVKLKNVLSYAFVNFLNRFRESNRKNYLFYFQPAEVPEDYHTLFIEPRKDLKRRSNDVYFSSVIKADQNKHLREIEITLDTTGASAPSFLAGLIELLPGKITLSFVSLEDKNYLSFVRFDFTIRVRHKLLENYVTEILLLSARPGIEPIARKDRFTKNSLYKAETHFTSEFWRSINIPLLTKEETKLLQELESKGIPVKVK